MVRNGRSTGVENSFLIASLVKVVFHIEGCNSEFFNGTVAGN